MTKYEFTVFLAGLTEITEEAANALFEAGCDDASPASCDGVVWSTFHREAPSLEHAIRSAVADVAKAAYRVERVEIGSDALHGLVDTTPYTRSIEPARKLAAEAMKLEHEISNLVNEAYGLTPDEIALMWKTAPPRMPIANQQ